jgi:hypothetical protein
MILILKTGKTKGTTCESGWIVSGGKGPGREQVMTQFYDEVALVVIQITCGP